MAPFRSAGTYYLQKTSLHPVDCPGVVMIALCVPYSKLIVFSNGGLVIDLSLSALSPGYCTLLRRMRSKKNSLKVMNDYYPINHSSLSRVQDGPMLILLSL